MNAFIIFLLAWLGIGSYDKLSKKAEAKRYRIENRGSRDVELEEWTRWSKTLFESYKQLTGLNIPYPKIRFTKGNIGHAFRNAFNGTANYPREIGRSVWSKNFCRLSWDDISFISPVFASIAAVFASTFNKNSFTISW